MTEKDARFRSHSRHWLTNPISTYIGSEPARCTCGDFEGDLDDYRVHVQAAHETEIAAFLAYDHENTRD